MIGNHMFISALKRSLPIAIGYIFLGTAFSILVIENGLEWFWAIIMSVFIYAGSLQFALIPLIVAKTPLWMIALMSLVINIRVIVYGLPFLQNYSNQSAIKKFYGIYTLTDETFSILLKGKKEGISVDEMICISFLNHFYWIFGTIIGVLVGNQSFIDFKGIDFSMTALFIIIVIEQWQQSEEKAPFIIGGCCALISLLFIGPRYFLIVGIIASLLTLSFLFYKKNRVE